MAHTRKCQSQGTASVTHHGGRHDGAFTDKTDETAAGGRNCGSNRNPAAWQTGPLWLSVNPPTIQGFRRWSAGP
jgi:hypothetical protein